MPVLKQLQHCGPKYKTNYTTAVNKIQEKHVHWLLPCKYQLWGCNPKQNPRNSVTHGNEHSRHTAHHWQNAISTTMGWQTTIKLFKWNCIQTHHGVCFPLHIYICVYGGRSKPRPKPNKSWVCWSIKLATSRRCARLHAEGHRTGGVELLKHHIGSTINS